MSAQKRKNFKEEFDVAYVIICPETLEIQNNFVILHRRSRRMTICLFHGVMVSTRVFGSLSPRSSRSGTTVKEKRFCVPKRGASFRFYASGMAK